MTGHNPFKDLVSRTLAERVAPRHPGEFLRVSVLPRLGISTTALAEHLGISRRFMSMVLRGERPVRPRLAVRLGQALGNGAAFWLTLQMHHDIAEAERLGIGGNVKPLEPLRPRYSLAELLAQCDPNAPVSDEDREFIDAPAVGRPGAS